MLCLEAHSMSVIQTLAAFIFVVVRFIRKYPEQK